MNNADEFEEMPALTDSETDTPTVQQSPAQVESTVVPSVLAGTNSSFPDEVDDVEVLNIEETTVWVHWLLANLPDSGEQLSGTNRFLAMNFINDSPAEQFKR